MLPRALGFGPFRTVARGDGLDRLTPYERSAVLLHELGHLYHRHPGRRVLRLLNPMLWPRLAELAKQDEFEADAFVAEFGSDFALALSLFLERMPNAAEGGPFHPSPMERIARLKKFHRLAGATGHIASPPNRATRRSSTHV